MSSAIFGIIVVPAAFAFVLGFMAHFFKTQAEPALETEPTPEELVPQEPAVETSVETSVNS